MSKVTHDLASTNLPELMSSMFSLICFKQVSFEFYSMEDRYCLYPASILPAPREFSVHWPFPIFSIKVSLICLRIFLNFSGNCLTSTEKPGGIQSIGSQRVWNNWSDLARPPQVQPESAGVLTLRVTLSQWDMGEGRYMAQAPSTLVRKTVRWDPYSPSQRLHPRRNKSLLSIAAAHSTRRVFLIFLSPCPLSPFSLWCFLR